MMAQLTFPSEGPILTYRFGDCAFYFDLSVTPIPSTLAVPEGFYSFAALLHSDCARLLSRHQNILMLCCNLRIHMGNSWKFILCYNLKKLKYNTTIPTIFHPWRDFKPPPTGSINHSIQINQETPRLVTLPFSRNCRFQFQWSSFGIPGIWGNPRFFAAPLWGKLLSGSPKIWLAICLDPWPMWRIHWEVAF